MWKFLYLIALVAGIVTLKTLLSFHPKALTLGLLKEDQECRANTIAWDLTRLCKLYQDQAESILELLPEGFSIEATLEALKKNELKKGKKNEI